jgi:murein DD-endopeptidase MepM/ murein hydrolase activator NlpD
MLISNPIKGFNNKKYPLGQISQGFGENPALYMAAIGMKSHNGIDIVAPWGTPLYAVESGTVCEVKTDPSGYGMHIRFLSDLGPDKTGNEWTYGHLSAIFVKIGDKIKVGQKIANMGNTGFVVSSINGAGYWIDGSNKYAGTHLHLTARLYKLDKRGWQYYPNTPKMTVLGYDNGWLGAYNFSSLFNPDPIMGDMGILKRQLESYGDEPWYMRLIRGLTFFNNK